MSDKPSGQPATEQVREAHASDIAPPEEVPDRSSAESQQGGAVPEPADPHIASQAEQEAQIAAAVASYQDVDEVVQPQEEGFVGESDEAAKPTSERPAGGNQESIPTNEEMQSGTQVEL